MEVYRSNLLEKKKKVVLHSMDVEGGGIQIAKPLCALVE